jgi:hypothetical protein
MKNKFFVFFTALWIFSFVFMACDTGNNTSVPDPLSDFYGTWKRIDMWDEGNNNYYGTWIITKNNIIVSVHGGTKDGWGFTGTITNVDPITHDTDGDENFNDYVENANDDFPNGFAFTVTISNQTGWNIGPSITFRTYIHKDKGSIIPGHSWKIFDKQ